MSKTDRAFINAFELAARSIAARRGAVEGAFHAAYVHDAAESVPPAPHMTLATVTAGCRQPLSAFVERPLVDAGFRPALQVEKFLWPTVCDTLSERLRDRLDEVSEQLSTTADEGHHVLAVAGCHRSEGRTTTLLCLARHLATPDRPIAMVDADFQQPQLAGRLGMAVSTGWENVLRNEVPLAEAVVQSCQDHLTLLPLRATVPDAPVLVDSLQSSTNLRVLRHHFRMVLVDLGPVLDASVAAPALKLAKRSGIDAALLVRDARTTTDDDLCAAVESFAGVGVPAIGIAETFATTVAA